MFKKTKLLVLVLAICLLLPLASLAAPTETTNWVVDPYGISEQYGLAMMLNRMGTRVLFQIGSWVIPYNGPTYDYCATFQDQVVGGGIRAQLFTGNFDIWVTPASVTVGPFGSLLLADIIITPGTNYRLWYSVRTTPWPPRNQ